MGVSYLLCNDYPNSHWCRICLGDVTMKIIHSSNSGIRSHIDKRELVVGSFNKTTQSRSIFAEQRENLYIVYSYGTHFPMYVYDETVGIWLGNQDKYSVSTSKHQSQAHPSEGILHWLSNKELKLLILEGGLVPYMVDKARAKYYN